MLTELSNQMATNYVWTNAYQLNYSFRFKKIFNSNFSATFAEYEQHIILVVFVYVASLKFCNQFALKQHFILIIQINSHSNFSFLTFNLIKETSSNTDSLKHPVIGNLFRHLPLISKSRFSSGVHLIAINKISSNQVRVHVAVYWVPIQNPYAGPRLIQYCRSPFQAIYGTLFPLYGFFDTGFRCFYVYYI